MKNQRKLMLFFLFFLIFSFYALSIERPFHTEDMNFLERGDVELQFGISYFDSYKNFYSNLDGDLFKFGEINLRFGLSDNTELDISWTAHNYYSLDSSVSGGNFSFTGDDTDDWGDARITTKIKILGETPATPGIGMKFQIKLPNSDDTKGIGLDTTDFFGTFIFQKGVGKLTLFTEVGLAIYGDPREGSNQIDKFVYGIGGTYKLNDYIDIVGEIYGNAFHDTEIYPNHGNIMGGLRLKTGNLRWDAGVCAGINNDNTYDYGFTFGLSYLLKGVFH